MTALEKIVGTAFQGETVLLDGRSFEDCYFELCTLRLEGFGPFELKNCEIVPGCAIETPSCPELSSAIWRQYWRSIKLKESDGIEHNG